MFRNLTMKKRLMLSGVVSMSAIFLLAALAIYSLWQSELELEKQIRMTKAVQLELTAEMMHDSIEARANYAILQGPEYASAGQQQLMAQLESDIAAMNRSFEALSQMQLSGEINAQITRIMPLAESFGAEARVVAETAFRDGAEAKAMMTGFHEQYEQIASVLKPLNTSLKTFAAESAANARAHDMMLLYMLLGVAVITTGGVFYSARNVMNTVTKPIERLRDALREVAEGDFGIKIAARMRADDFGEIARDIDVISDRVTDALAEQNALRAEGEKVIERLRAGMTRLAKGDFSDRIDDRFPGSYDALRQNYNETVDRLNELLAQVVQASNRIQGQSVEIQGGSENLSSRTESQAATLEETAAALEEMTRSVNSSAQNAKEVETVVENARKDVERSGEVVEGAISAMNEIENSSNQISQIIGVIDDIAFQTNLLALNAGVEAARAGEVGRGFAVVASEVRGLAQRSSDAANEIKTLIGASTRNVQDGVEKVDGAGKALSSVVTQVANIAELVTGITGETEEQAQGLNEINVGVSQLDSVTQQNASMVEESGNAIRVMNQETVGLNQLVGQFVLRDGSGQSSQPAWQPPAAAAAPAAEEEAWDDGGWDDDAASESWDQDGDFSDFDDDGGLAKSA